MKIAKALRRLFGATGVQEPGRKGELANRKVTRVSANELIPGEVSVLAKEDAIKRWIGTPKVDEQPGKKGVLTAKVQKIEKKTSEKLDDVLERVKGLGQFVGMEVRRSKTYDFLEAKSKQAKKATKRKVSKAWKSAKASDFAEKVREVRRFVADTRPELKDTVSEAAKSGLDSVKQKFRREANQQGTNANKVFGVSLEETMDKLGGELPPVIKESIAYLQQHGLKTKGIFREAGRWDIINQLAEAFDRGQNPLQNPGQEVGVHEVAGLLKKYFKELPPGENVLPVPKDKALLGYLSAWKPPKMGGVTESDSPPQPWSDQVSEDQKKAWISQTLKQVSPNQQKALDAVISLLQQIEKKSKENDMTMTNLATAFGISLMFSWVSHVDDFSEALTRPFKANGWCELLVQCYMPEIDLSDH